MIVIALEGCHGCGKTELVQEFASAGFPTMDEAFMDMPSFCSLHPQSLLMETNWVCGWFQRVLQIANEKRFPFLVVDRSPLSAVFYTSNHNGAVLQPLIFAQIQELRDLAHIDIYTVHVTCTAEVLWRRIKSRLEREPERSLFKEDSQQWMFDVKSFYDNFPHWDFTVKNDGEDKACLKRVIGEVISVVQNKVPTSPSWSEKTRMPVYEVLAIE